MSTLRTPKQEAENAFAYGVRDATNGRERKNGSDFYGPYGHDYDQGYQSVVNARRKPIYKAGL
tara:strand:- start:274 stop:462 length:189 start_codon:yes stop_codon:yes gene_type:complete